MSLLTKSSDCRQQAHVYPFIGYAQGNTYSINCHRKAMISHQSLVKFMPVNQAHFIWPVTVMRFSN